jgi:hypothetical protein
MLAAVVSGCMPEANRPPQGPSEVSMATHISAVHNVRIGEDAAADIIVFETNAQVRVRFTDGFRGRVAGDCLMVLRFSEPQKTFDKQGYLAFLDQLHAYLTLTPVKPRPAGAGGPAGQSLGDAIE